MDAMQDAGYRLRLAEGYVQEASEDLTLKRWRSCVDNSQLAAKNAAKAALALLGPVGRTHNPAPLLRQALGDGRFPAELTGDVQRLAETAELLGPPVPISTDYGDEDARLTPWELLAESDAGSALSMAEEAVAKAQALVHAWPP